MLGAFPNKEKRRAIKILQSIAQCVRVTNKQTKRGKEFGSKKVSIITLGCLI